MSTEQTANKTGTGRQQQRRYNVDKSTTAKERLVNKIDITALQIDESFSADCDPYNSTGLHLVDAVKASQEDE